MFGDHRSVSRCLPYVDSAKDAPHSEIGILRTMKIEDEMLKLPTPTHVGLALGKESVREIVMFSAGLFTAPAEIDLTWQTTPPRMPIPAPAT